MLIKYNFFCQKYKYNKRLCNPSGNFQNNYEKRTINGDKMRFGETWGINFAEGIVGKGWAWNSQHQCISYVRPVRSVIS
jgi:hypothetical protein